MKEATWMSPIGIICAMAFRETGDPDVIFDRGPSEAGYRDPAHAH